MKQLEAPDAHHFNAACGWSELGNRTEAWAELALITPENQTHPAVLDLRWSLCAGDQKWGEAFRVAQQFLAAAPDNPAGWLHSAYAARRMAGGGIERAQSLLLPAADKFPDEPVIVFNLACYACQLDQLDAARRWFQRACDCGGAKAMRAMALADEDLKPLWPEIRAA
jgi:predicted Zn-dependent protease